MDVAPVAMTVDHLAHKDRPPVAQLRRKPPELVSRIGHGQGVSALWRGCTGKYRGTLGTVERVGIEPQFLGQRTIERHEFGCWNCIALPRPVEAFKIAGVAVVERDVDGHLSGLASILLC